MEERRRASWISGLILVRGDVVSSGDLVIDGQVQGGTVVGSVTGAARVELKATGSIEGDVNAPTFVMEEGATLKGKVDTGNRKR